MYGAKMPTAAKQISNREMMRRAKEAISVGTMALHTLLAVLQQKGGTVTVTAGTLNQITRNLDHLDFSIEHSPDVLNEVVVRLVDTRDTEKIEDPAPELDHIDEMNIARMEGGE